MSPWRVSCPLGVREGVTINHGCSPLGTDAKRVYCPQELSQNVFMSTQGVGWQGKAPDEGKPSPLKRKRN